MHTRITLELSTETVMPSRGLSSEVMLRILEAFVARLVCRNLPTRPDYVFELATTMPSQRSNVHPLHTPTTTGRLSLCPTLPGFLS